MGTIVETTVTTTLKKQGAVGRTSASKAATNETSLSEKFAHGVGMVKEKDNGLSRRDGPPADYETAISSCGYGKFNYLMAAGFIPITCFSQMFVSGSTGFIMPAAECDLNLTDFQKGMLNAAVYAGNIVAGMAWGAVGDKFGRQKLLVITFFADFIVSFACSFVHAFWLLLLLKLLGGIIVSGPGSLILAYIAETHNNAHRAQTIMWIGMGYGLGGLVQPAIASLIIPLDFRIPLVPGVLDLTSWRVFLMISAIPSFVSGVCCLFLPETPKFLMSQGREKEALQVFKKIYTWNSGKKPNTYPIGELKTEPPKAEGDKTESSNAWAQQFKTLLLPLYLKRVVMVVIIQVGIMLGVNYIRLWTPQLFSFVEQYDEIISLKEGDGGGAGHQLGSACEMITTVLQAKPGSVNQGRRCQPVPQVVYLRATVIGAMITASYLFSGMLVRKVGQRAIVRTCLPLAACAAIALNWAVGVEWMMGLLGAFSTLSSNSNNALAAVMVELFPTSIRAFAVSFVVMCGRASSMVGNLFLPVLLEYSCQGVFYCIGVVVLVSGAMAFQLPSANEKN